LPIHPSDEGGDRSRIVAKPVAGATDDAQVGQTTGRVREGARVAHRHRLIVAAVQK
jgi:hypothetical protein